MDAGACGHAPVVDGGAHHRAVARLAQAHQQRSQHGEATDDQEEPIAHHFQPGQMDAAVKPLRQLERLHRRPEEPGTACDGDEHDADRQQHLVERARPVEPAVEQHFEHRAGQCRGCECRSQRRQEADTPAVHRHARRIAADHRKTAVRQVDEVHQPERDRQADRDQEKQHAVGHAVEQDRGHAATWRRCRLWPDRRPCRSGRTRHSPARPSPAPSCGCRPSGRCRGSADRSRPDRAGSRNAVP